MEAIPPVFDEVKLAVYGSENDSSFLLFRFILLTLYIYYFII